MVLFPMPGTIQVTVLEFKGVSSSSKPCAKSLKVSMGKRQFQTWDKGDFSFPITKLREDLFVSLLDAAGNEIAHQGIRIMQIIEKGSWDEVFSINEGGHVHMKLQFILSDEDRNRIRLMRESAVKKKLEMNPSIKHRFSEAVASTSDSVEISIKHEHKVVSESSKRVVEIDLVSPEVVEASSQAGSSLASASASASSSAVSLSCLSKQEGSIILESSIPVKELPADGPDGSQGTPPSSPAKHEIKIVSPQVQERLPADEKSETRQPLANIRSGTEKGPPLSMSDKNNSVVSKLQDNYPILNQDSVERTPSNVRKMISAFEHTQIQEVKSLKNARSVPSQLNRLHILEEGQQSKNLVPPATDKSLRDFKDQLAGNLHQTPTTHVTVKASADVSSDSELSLAPKGDLSRENDSSEPTLKEPDKLAVDLMRQSSSVTATSSGRIMPEEKSPYMVSSNSSGSSSVAAEGIGSGSGRRTSLKSSTMINIHVASDTKQKTLEYYSARSSGMWIFPDNTRRLCITTAGKPIMKIVGHHNNEAKTHRANKISSESEVVEKNLMHKTEDKMEKNLEQSAESGCGSSPGDDSSNGLVGQAIKIAVIIGFGVLVLLTRQKEPRKKQKEDNDWSLTLKP